MPSTEPDMKTLHAFTHTLGILRLRIFLNTTCLFAVCFEIHTTFRMRLILANKYQGVIIDN